MPTVQGTDDFNHAIDAGFYTDGFFGTPVAVGTPLYASQPATLEIETPGGAEGVRHDLSGSPTRGWAAFPFQTPALASGSFSVANFSTPGGSSGQMLLGSTGLFIANSTNNGAETPITPDTWYWVEMIFDVSANPHQVYGRVNGVDMGAPPTGHAVAADAIEFHQLVNFGDTGETALYGWWQWGTAASISDWLGEPVGLEPGYQRIVGPEQLAAAAATVFTVPTGMKAELRSVDLNNPSGSLRKVTLSVGTDAAATRVLELLDIPAGGSLNLRRGINHTLEAGETLQAYADSAGVVVATINANVEDV